MWPWTEDYIAKIASDPDQIPYKNRLQTTNGCCVYKEPVVFPGYCEKPGQSGIRVDSTEYADTEILGFHLPRDAPSGVAINMMNLYDQLKPGEFKYAVVDKTLFPLSIMKRMWFVVTTHSGKSPRFCGLDMVLVKLPEDNRGILKVNDNFAKLPRSPRWLFFDPKGHVQTKDHVSDNANILPSFRKLQRDVRTDACESTSQERFQREVKDLLLNIQQEVQAIRDRQLLY